MKRFKLISILSLFLLSSCSLFNNNVTLTAKYVKKNSTEELSYGETIKYGESFDFDHFVLYKTSNGKTTKVNSGYKVTISGGSSKEEMFKSSKPEVGEYNFGFEYQGKYTGLGFKVDKNSALPSNISMSMEDWDYLGDKKQPTFSNYTVTEDSRIDYHLFKLDPLEDYAMIQLDDGLKVSLEPGHYKIEASISDSCYIGATVSCEFYVNKIDFPTDILEIYKPSFDYNFTINGFTLSDYPLERPQVRYIDTKQNLPVAQEKFYLTWKDETETISTDEITKHKVIMHTDYFNDYEYEVNVKVSKLEVDLPGGIYIDDISSGHGTYIKYDGEEHSISIFHNAYFGQYEINEELSTITATEIGTYDVYISLVDKTNLLWKTYHNNVDRHYTWTIGS